MPADLSLYSFEALWHPWVFAWILLIQVAYLLAVGPWRRAFRWGPPVPLGQKLAFSAAVWTVYIADGTPIHLIAENYLFSFHMVEHVLLTMVFPPLFIVGIPTWMVRPLLRWRPMLAMSRVLTHPVLALLLFNLIYSLWHLPVAYEAVLYYHWFHGVQHVILVATAVISWMPVCSLVPELPRLSDGGQMLYIFLSGVAQIAVFGVITFAETHIYDFYAAAPRLWAISPMMDQQLAGVVMKVGGMAVYLIAWGIIFFRWAAREERAMRAQPSGHASG